MTTRTYTRTTPIQAIQYDGTRRSADEIAEAFGLDVTAQHDRGAVFAVPRSGPQIMVTEYDRDTHEFAIITTGWVWRDTEMNTIGAEWDDYFHRHWTPLSDGRA